MTSKKEQTFYQGVTETFGSDFSIEFKSLWKKFLDDCFIPWTKSKEDLNTLHNILNNLHDFVKFNMDFNEEQLPFLDCMVMKQGRRIETDIFYKLTDKKNLPFIHSMSFETHKSQYSFFTCKTP